MIHINKLKTENTLIDDQHPLTPEERTLFESHEDFVNFLESDENSDLDARVLCATPNRSLGFKKFNKKEFIEASKASEKNLENVSFREGIDAFSTDVGDMPTLGNVGDDFVPLLGGPFYRQLYQLDYIRQANASFYAYNHDPLAHAAINILSDFTLGRGYRVDSSNKAALALWRSFEVVNKLPQQMLQVSKEISIYGEVMLWKLPKNQTKIVQNPYSNQTIPIGLLPRVRLIDPTVIYDYITDPEDITSVLYYVWLAPTQYQVFSGLEKGKQVPASKFIFQQIPAYQISHYKVNSVSNEKRGRSDLFSGLGYLKRLRDSVNYSIISLQKQSAFCIDTVVRGSQSDLDAYIQEQQSLGTIAPAGSEFVHTDAIERKYLGVEGGKGSSSSAFEWAFSMFAASVGIPMSYFGSHLSGGQTRASAIVSTEPVAKRFEQRQVLFEKIINDLWDFVMEWAGLGKIDCEITFPELITQDRSQKLKDLALAESQKWISKETAAKIAAKEFNLTSFEFGKEQREIEEEEGGDQTSVPSSLPLSSPSTHALTSQDKVEIKKQYV